MTTNEAQHQEKRLHKRYECNFPIKVITDDGEYSGVCVDISVGGIRLVSSRLLATGNTVTLQFRLPVMVADIRVGARVCWAVEHFAGLQFVSLSSDAALEFIKLLDERKLLVLQ